MDNLAGIIQVRLFPKLSLTFSAKVTQGTYQKDGGKMDSVQEGRSMVFIMNVHNMRYKLISQLKQSLQKQC